jgi:hypothetical protein
MKTKHLILLLAIAASHPVFSANLTTNDTIASGSWSTTSPAHISGFFDSRKRFDLTELGGGEYTFTISFTNPGYYWGFNYWFSTNPNDEYLSLTSPSGPYSETGFVTNSHLNDISGTLYSYTHTINLDGNNNNYLFVEQRYSFYPLTITYENIPSVPIPASGVLFLSGLTPLLFSNRKKPEALPI